MSDWQIGLFDCTTDDHKDLCLSTTFCICCQHGRNMQALESSEDGMCILHCVIYGLMQVFGSVTFRIPMARLGAILRRKIRRKKGLQDADIFEDMFAHACCCWCAVAQEAVQVGAPVYCGRLGERGR